MATLDSLQADINALTSRVNSLESSSTSHGTKIQNLEVIQGQHTTQLNTHESRLNQHDITLENHEGRLKKLEESTLRFEFIREGKMPVVNSKGLIHVYMPDKLTLEDFKAVNQNVSLAQNFNWFRKISNSVGAGKVCFDFDREDGIKSILLGQDTRVVIPTGIKVLEITPEKSTLKVVNDEDLIMEEGLCFGVEVVVEDASKEVLLSLCNYTNHSVHIYRGQVIAALAHLFQYKTTPQIIK